MSSVGKSEIGTSSTLESVIVLLIESVEFFMLSCIFLDSFLILSLTCPIIVLVLLIADWTFEIELV